MHRLLLKRQLLLILETKLKPTLLKQLRLNKQELMNGPLRIKQRKNTGLFPKLREKEIMRSTTDKLTRELRLLLLLIRLLMNNLLLKLRREKERMLLLRLQEMQLMLKKKDTKLQLRLWRKNSWLTKEFLKPKKLLGKLTSTSTKKELDRKPKEQD